MLVDTHSGLVFAKLEDIAAIFMGIRKKKRPKKLILSLHLHPEKGYQLNLNSLMGCFGFFWVTSQYALLILGENGTSRASHQYNHHASLGQKKTQQPLYHKPKND